MMKIKCICYYVQFSADSNQPNSGIVYKFWYSCIIQ